MFAFLDDARLKRIPLLLPAASANTIKIFWISEKYSALSAPGAGGMNFADVDSRPDVCVMWLKNLNSDAAAAEKFSQSAAHEVGHALGLALLGDHLQHDNTPYKPFMLMCRGQSSVTDSGFSNYLIPGSPDKSAKHWTPKDGMYMRAFTGFCSPQ